MFIRIIWFGFACFTAVAQFGKNAGFAYGKVVPEDPSLDMDSEMRALKIYGNAGNKLFFVDPANQMMSWYAALEFCQNHEMNLATITTEAENKIFQADNSAPKSFYSLGDHKKYFWLAGTDMADDGNFYWMGSKGHKEFDFKSWAPNKPSGGVRSNCVRTDENGEWSDAGCSRNHQPLCESVDNLNLIGRANHKQFWVQTSPYETKQLTWNEALEFCHRYDGMRLASFPTKFELDRLSQFFNNHTADAFWISLTDYEMEGTFKWMVTGENLTYSNWGINEPSGGRQMNCVYLYHGGFENSTAEWFNDNCFRKHRPICETDTFGVKSAEFAYSYGDPVPEPSEIAKGTITTTVPSYIVNKGTSESENLKTEDRFSETIVTSGNNPSISYKRVRQGMKATYFNFVKDKWCHFLDKAQFDHWIFSPKVTSGDLLTGAVKLPIPPQPQTDNPTFFNFKLPGGYSLSFMQRH